MEGAAVVKDAVQENAKTEAMCLFRKCREKTIGRLEILRVRAPLLVARRIEVVARLRREQFSAVFRNDGEMRVDVLVILGIVLVIRGRDKERIEIDHFDAEVF